MSCLTQKLSVLELDGLFIWVGKKKNQVQVWTAIDRDSGTFAGLDVRDGSDERLKSFLKELRIRYTVDVVCIDKNYCYEKYAKKAFKDV